MIDLATKQETRNRVLLSEIHEGQFFQDCSGYENQPSVNQLCMRLPMSRECSIQQLYTSGVGSASIPVLLIHKDSISTALTFWPHDLRVKPITDVTLSF